jgi:phosphatidyl-myo-inositol alpha-mannosyltransferase
MRVALVCPYDIDVPGGVQDQVLRLQVWLRDAGHEAIIVAPGVDGPDETVLLGRSTVIRANRSAAPIALDPRVLGRVKVAVRDADVIHIHEPFMPAVSLAAARIRTIPSVGTFHADASSTVRAALRIGSPVTRMAAARLDVMTAVSDVARSAVGVLPGIRIIPNGIDVGRYAEAAVHTHRQNARIVFVGRDDPRKGLDVLLAAWPAVIDAVPHASLDVVGSTRDAELPGVTFRGRVDEHTKRAFLASAAIGVAPNLGGESFGIVVLEMMAAGCAVVASAIPAFVKVLGDAGELVKPGDAAGLADRLIALLRDDERRAALGAGARVAAARYDGPVVAGQYLEAYRDAIAIHG